MFILLNLPVEGLLAAVVIGVDMNDSGAGAGASDTLRDYCFHRVGNTRLESATPCASQRRFNSNFVHYAASSDFVWMPPRK
jgi:hypothetical protein